MVLKTEGNTYATIAASPFPLQGKPTQAQDVAVLQILYIDSNNAVEYEALLHGLRMAVSMSIQHLEVCGDSNLAISQINGYFNDKDQKMAAYRNAILKMSARFEGLEFHHVVRENN